MQVSVAERVDTTTYIVPATTPLLWDVVFRQRNDAVLPLSVAVCSPEPEPQSVLLLI